MKTKTICILLSRNKKLYSMPRIVEEAAYVPEGVNLLGLCIAIWIDSANADFNFVFFDIFWNLKLEIPKSPRKTSILL